MSDSSKDVAPTSTTLATALRRNNMTSRSGWFWATANEDDMEMMLILEIKIEIERNALNALILRSFDRPTRNSKRYIIVKVIFDPARTPGHRKPLGISPVQAARDIFGHRYLGLVLGRPGNPELLHELPTQRSYESRKG